MPVKLPACEPCRISKQACDHAKPCARCREREAPLACIYRPRPFKKRRVEDSAGGISHVNTTNPVVIVANLESPEPPKGTRNYPNPGFLGSSSHTTFFEQLPRDTNETDRLPDYSIDEEEIQIGANIIEQIHKNLPIQSCVMLVRHWISTGVNLALAGPLISTCAQAAEHLLNLRTTGSSAHMISQGLFRHSSQPINAQNNQTIANWCTIFGVHNARWEMLGLFFAALAAATMHTNSFETLYQSHQSQRNLQKLAVRFSDKCLDISLSLDRLNDLQLLLQYENWISHSCLDGDQSYISWRKLGDIISSLYALGYHERTEATPPTLNSFRELVFARTFSGDSNVSLFLGRPPRIDRKHCKWLPRQFEWSLDAEVDYAVETKWSTICSVLKGEAVDLFHQDDNNEKLKRATLIREHANLQWSSLPPQFRLETSLKDCTRPPKERDFLLSTLLNHLHVHFLLYLQLQERVNEPGSELVSISAKMFTLVIEAVLLKDSLAYSGTTLDWKVAYYGLAAAGIICLSLLKPTEVGSDGGISRAQMIQDLNVLVAVVETGALFQPINPNYALLSRAALTIKSLLRRLLSKDVRQQPALPYTGPLLQDAETFDPATWNLWDNQYLQDFEVDFWLNLAEHPFLTETPINSLPTTQAQRSH